MRTLTTSQKVAIAISVPAVAVFVYLVVKWSRDEQDDDEEEEGQDFAPTSQYSLEMKIPKYLVGTIIGRGGCNVKQIQKETHTRINLKDEEESDSEQQDGDIMATKVEREKERVLLIKGSRERAKEAELWIRKIITEQPVVETESVDLPIKVIGQVIGKAGKTIRQLCRISGAKIKIDNDDTRSDKKPCSITGTRTQIDYAKALIQEKIDEVQYYKSKEKETQQSNAHKENLSVVTLPRDGDYFGVYVSAMQHPGRFWVQTITKDSRSLDELIEEMTVYYGYNGGGTVVSAPNVGDLCCAPFKHDISWYRGRITSVVSPSELGVLYLDFGDSGPVPLGNVKELRKDFCQLPFQAVECCLANIKPKDEEWSQEACDVFEKLNYCAQWKVLMARIVSECDSNGRTAVELFDTNGEKDINIEVEMINGGFADYINCSEDLRKDEACDESPRTPRSSPLSKSDEAVAEEEFIKPEQVAEQFQGYNFDDQPWRSSTSPPYDFISESSSEDESSSIIVTPDATVKMPVDEPALSATQQNLVSCVNVEHLPNLLAMQQDPEDLTSSNGTNSSTTDVPDHSSVPWAQLESPSEGTTTIATTLASNGQPSHFSLTKDNLDNQLSHNQADSNETSHEANLTNIIPTPSTPQQPNTGETPSNTVHTTLATSSTSSGSSATSSETPVASEITAKPSGSIGTSGVVGATSESGLNNEEEQGSSCLEKGQQVFKEEQQQSVRRVTDDTIVEPEVVDGQLNMQGTPTRADGGSKSTGPRQAAKSGKRMLAANFSQFSNHSTRQESDDDGEQTDDNEDDDESLYLSAREDTDSTGFVSATGSTLDLQTPDSEGDVTPSGYLSDAEGDSYGSLGTPRKARLNDTLLAEQLEHVLSDK